jgi:hypothetical protein
MRRQRRKWKESSQKLKRRYETHRPKHPNSRARRSRTVVACEDMIQALDFLRVFSCFFSLFGGHEANIF